MTGPPDVSVVIPTRNRADLVRLAVASALRQTSVAVEVVVIDEGSTDGTQGLLAELPDERVLVLRNPTAVGESGARNQGIQHARGRWVAFLDDDDLWAPDKLRKQLEAARQQDGGWVVCGSVSFSEGPTLLAHDPPPPPERIARRLAFVNLVPSGASSVMVRQRLLETVGAWDPTFRHLADWDFWIRLARHQPPTVVDEPLVAYRVHAGSKSLVRPSAVLADARIIEGRYREERQGAPIEWAWLYHWMADGYQRTGHPHRARLARLRASAASDIPLRRRFRRRMRRFRQHRALPTSGPPQWPPGVRAWLSSALEQ